RKAMTAVANTLLLKKIQWTVGLDPSNHTVINQNFKHDRHIRLLRIERPAVDHCRGGVIEIALERPAGLPPRKASARRDRPPQAAERGTAVHARRAERPCRRRIGRIEFGELG